MGNFNRELPENYFDLVFSISTLEHVPEDETTFKNVCLDIDRVLRPNGYSLHCFDVIVKKDAVWSNKLLPFIFEYYNTLHKFVPFSELYDDPDLWSMSETAYNRGWKPTTKKDYAEHGKPISYNVLWQKQTDNSHLRRPLPASQKIIRKLITSEKAKCLSRPLSRHIRVNVIWLSVLRTLSGRP